MTDLRAFAPTFCRLFGIPAPELSRSRPLGDFLEYEGKVRRALIYCPDAFGLHALNRRPDLEKRLRAVATHVVDLQSVFPPVTPVCFASLFTGASPEQHGIRQYEKPVLACDTVFDAFLRAGKRVAIIAVKDSSMDRIFRGRQLDYYSMEDDDSVQSKALELLRADAHDMIVVYQQEYDDLLHETGPFSSQALTALEHHARAWEELVQICDEVWKHEYLVAFTPDHGAHLDPRTGKGDHGENSPEDMCLRHFFRVK